jgi:3',5'-cyclic AMP phosphodiesterase CpdA
MSVLLHLSDTHFGTERANVVEALVRFNGHLKPQLCVISGDITQRAQRAQFTAARAFRDRLKVLQTLVIPGNHDISLFNPFARFLAPYRAFARAFGDDTERVIDTPEFLVIGVNTTSRWRHIQGAISTAQIDQVCARLKPARARQLRLVVMHQPVHVTESHDEHNLLHNADAAVRAFATAGADLILGGHIHLPYVAALSARYPGLARELHCVQAGTAISHRTRSDVPNSVNVIRTSGKRDASIERWDFGDRGEFECVGKTALQSG